MARQKDRRVLFGSFAPFIRVYRNSENVRKRPPFQKQGASLSRSMRLQAKSVFVYRFVLSHRILLFTVVAMLVLGGVGISNSSAVKQTLLVLAGNPYSPAST